MMELEAEYGVNSKITYQDTPKKTRKKRAKKVVIENNGQPETP